jgi:hypothetical protein
VSEVGAVSTIVLVGPGILGYDERVIYYTTARRSRIAVARRFHRLTVLSHSSGSTDTRLSLVTRRSWFALLVDSFYFSLGTAAMLQPCRRRVDQGRACAFTAIRVWPFFDDTQVMRLS